MKKLGFLPKVAQSMFSLTTNAYSELLCNRRIVGGFSLAMPIRQGYPLAPLLFVEVTDSLILDLEATIERGIISSLLLPNGKKLLAKMFVNDSLFLLKVEASIFRNFL